MIEWVARLSMAQWLVGLALVPTGMVVAATISCAVAESFVRLAAWLYSPNPERRSVRRDEWLAQLEDLDVGERPGFAGEMLWVGLKRAPRRARGRFSSLRYRSGRPPKTSTDATAEGELARAQIQVMAVGAIAVGVSAAPVVSRAVGQFRAGDLGVITALLLFLVLPTSLAVCVRFGIRQWLQQRRR